MSKTIVMETNKVGLKARLREMNTLWRTWKVINSHPNHTMIEEGNAKHEVKYLEKKLLSSHREDSEDGDGPCQCLIQYMESHNRIPPSDWAGY